jgi:hypothetical protein
MPEDRLTLRERAALLVLMAEARALTNAELKTLAGFPLDGQPRKRLNELGYVTSTLVNRAYEHELTDAGAVRCTDELSGLRPTRSGSAGGALYTVLAGLRRHLERTGESLPDIFQPNTLAQVEAAYIRLTRGRGGTVRLTEVRKELGGVPRQEVDRALHSMANREDVHIRSSADQKTLTEHDRAAAVVLGGVSRHFLMIEVPQ